MRILSDKHLYIVLKISSSQHKNLGKNDMRRKATNLLLFLVFTTILMVSIPSIIGRDSKGVTNIGFDLESGQVSWNVSDYDEFIGAPINTSSTSNAFRIYIDDDDPDYNWTKTEEDYAWCTGAGIEGDPYIIENLYIDAQGDGGGIYIRDSVKHFIIRNCWINNSGTHSIDAAVFLEYVENGNITDNIFSYTRVGLQGTYSCFDISVSENYMISNPVLGARAIKLSYNCNNFTIIRNKIFNFYDGMHFAIDIHNLTLRNNYITNTVFEEWEDPPVRFREVNNSKVIYNTLDGVYAQTGVFVQVLGGTGNTFFNNTIVSGGVDVPEVPILSADPKLSAPDSSALNFEDCNYNLIAHNRILSSSDTGIPGYDTLLILGLFGIIFTTLAIRINLKKKQV